MSWRVAKSLVQLETEIKAFSPNTVFGTIGDEQHQQEASDHNPNAAGVVCALDIMDGNGLNLASIAEQIRTSNHPDLKYVIHDHQIASRTHGLVWRTYTGSDPHTNHVHVSVGDGSDGHSVEPYDDTDPWGVTSNGVHMALGDRDLRQGDQGDDVAELQRLLLAKGYTLGTAGADGKFGPATNTAVHAFQVAAFGAGNDDGVVGPKTVAALKWQAPADPAPAAPADPAPASAVDLGEVLGKLDTLTAKLDALAAHLGLEASRV